MSLEKIVEGARRVDADIHRQYERLGRKLDEKSEKGRYYAAGVFHVVSIPYVLNLSTNVSLLLSGLLAMDGGATYFSIRKGLPDQQASSDVKVKENPAMEFYMVANRITRSPLFLAGVGMALAGGYGTITSLLDNGSGASDSYQTLAYGLSLMSFSSSMYLKDRKSGLLEGSSSLSEAYGWASRKVKEMFSGGESLSRPVYENRFTP